MLKPSHFPRKAFNSTEPSCLNCSTWWESAYCISLTLSIFPSSPLTFFHLSLHLSLSLSYHSSSYSTSFSIQFNLTHLICMNITWAKLSRYLNTTWTSLSLSVLPFALSLSLHLCHLLPSILPRSVSCSIKENMIKSLLIFLPLRWRQVGLWTELLTFKQ